MINFLTPIYDGYGILFCGDGGVIALYVSDVIIFSDVDAFRFKDDDVELSLYCDDVITFFYDDVIPFPIQILNFLENKKQYLINHLNLIQGISFLYF